MKPAHHVAARVLPRVRMALFALGTTWCANPLAAQEGPWRVDLEMVAKIREEGLQRSELPNTFSYMTDVLGARLTNSADMDRAQRWVVGEMERMGLVNVEREPFMEYGVSWDNEYVSLHMLEPDERDGKSGDRGGLVAADRMVVSRLQRRRRPQRPAP